jgi:hypothetical protein
MQIASIGAKTWTTVSNNLTTDYVPTPDSYYTSPDTRVAVTTVEPVNTASSVVEPDPPRGYDVEAHQRLANYAATSLENMSQDIDSQNNFISEIFGALSGTIS